MRYDKIYDTKDLVENNRRNLAKMGTRETKMLAKIVQFDLLKELTNNLKNFTSVTQEQWKKTILKLKNYSKMFKLKDDKFAAFIKVLLPLLGAFLGALFTFKNNEKSTAEAGGLEIKLPNGEFSSDPDKIQKEFEKLCAGPSNDSKVKQYCDEKRHGFSYSLVVNDSPDGTVSNTTDDTSDNCIVSMCPPEEVPADLSTLLSLMPVEMPNGIVVEYDRRYPRRYDVNVGQVLSFNDPIGVINGVTVKSHIRGIVTEKTNNYFVAEYIDELPEIDVDSLIEQYQNTELEKINELFTNNANVTNFIKDYLLELRIPAIANHVSGQFFGLGNEVSTSKYLKKYRKKGENIIKEYEKRTKKTCSSTNVEAYGKASKLNVLKQILDDDKKKTFEQIKDLYYNYKNLGYCSKGRIADYMLYDEYMDYITDEERFRYDDKNPYVVKQFKLICKFIGTRSKIEKNCDNLPSLINKFNKLCKKTLKKHWYPNGGDYYTTMKSIFRHEYYTNDPEQLIEAVATDKDAVTMYSKVNDYLKALCNYTPPQDQTIQYSDDMDVMALLKSNQEDNTDRSFESDLKKIAFNFCLIRNVEASANDNSIFENNIANRAIVIAFYILDLISGIFIEEYDENYIGIDPLILASLAILRPYLKTLKKITQSEVYEMEQLGREVLKWYDEKGDMVNDKHIFDSFKEIGWGTETVIYKDNRQYDFIYLTYEETDPDAVLANAEPFDFDNDDPGDDYYDSGSYIKSKSGANSMLYWLRYLTIATVVNCMLPIYWGTGIIIAGVPVILPIIMLPIFVLPGRVTVVFGIGLCGICPMPLILFANLGNSKASILVPLNILGDTLKKTIQQAMSKLKDTTLKAAYAPIILSMEAKINQYNKEVDNIEMEIHNINSAIKENKKAMRNIRKRRKEDPTSCGKK